MGRSYRPPLRQTGRRPRQEYQRWIRRCPSGCWSGCTLQDRRRNNRTGNTAGRRSAIRQRSGSPASICSVSVLKLLQYSFLFSLSFIFVLETLRFSSAVNYKFLLLLFQTERFSFASTFDGDFSRSVKKVGSPLVPSGSSSNGNDFFHAFFNFYENFSAGNTRVKMIE